MNKPPRRIDAEHIETSISMLKRYVGEDDIAPLIDVLESITAAPDNDALLERLSDVFDGLGLLQGAVLTYAPYLSTLLSDDLFDESD